ncbi:MAG: NAD(P)H-dependent oxidoreductase subunit E [bacterium]|nr:NAD(P)H-dependent oxidoreductase subunit E [bacterium]
MAWNVIDRNPAAYDAEAGPVLSEAVRAKIRSFFVRYETKRAALLPALHVVQDALGHVSLAAMVEIAELLEIMPAEVLDTVGFYTHFWTEPKGTKVVVVCRSISCACLGGVEVLQAIKDELGIGEHQSTPDGKYALTTEECLAGCDHAPCVLINEKLHKRVQAADVPKLLADPDNDKLAMPRSDLYDAPSDSGNGQEEDPPSEAPSNG